MTRDAVIVDAVALNEALASADPPVLLDVRWALGQTDGHDRYLDGHLPGAVFVDLDTELAGPASPQEGRHPLPDLAVFEAAARRWGVSGERRSWPTTRSAGCPPRACGGCCAGPACATCGCSTAGSRRGRKRGCRSRPDP